MSRDINLLTPSCKAKCNELIKLSGENGLVFNTHWIITCTARLAKEQIALYSQGRNPLSVVNHYRILAGLLPIKEYENKKVTWTLNSLHVIDLDDDQTDNNLSRAFDVAVKNGRNVIWDLKVSVAGSALPDYAELASYGKQVGLDCGFYWKKQDPPHYQDLA